MANYTLNVLRNHKLFDSREAAVEALDNFEHHSFGQPISVLYKSTKGNRLLFAVGIKNADEETEVKFGSDFYEIINDSANVDTNLYWKTYLYGEIVETDTDFEVVKLNGDEFDVLLKQWTSELNDHVFFVETKDEETGEVVGKIYKGNTLYASSDAVRTDNKPYEDLEHRQADIDDTNQSFEGSYGTYVTYQTPDPDPNKRPKGAPESDVPLFLWDKIKTRFIWRKLNTGKDPVSFVTLNIKSATDEKYVKDIKDTLISVKGDQIDLCNYVTPVDGYIIKGFSKDGVTVDPLVDGKYIVTSTQDDTYFAHVVFDESLWATITLVSNDGTKGVVEGGGKFTKGSIITIKAIPNEETFCDLESWTKGKEIISSDKELSILVEEDVTLTANFINTHLLTLERIGEGIIDVTPYNSIYYNRYLDNTQINITGTPDSEQYYVEGYIKDEEGEHQGSTYSFNITTDKEVEVLFYPTCVITYSCETTERGEIDYDLQPSYFDNTRYREGDEINITATPKEGYEFTGWEDDTKDNPRLIKVYADKDIVAYFSKDTCRATYLDADGVEIESIREEVEYGKTFTKPDYTPTKKGFKFVYWYVGEDETKEYDFSTIAVDDIILNPCFTDEQYTIGFTDDKGYFTLGVEGVDNSAYIGKTFSFSTTVPDGTTFSQWEDGNGNVLGTDPLLLTVTITEDMLPLTVRAAFLDSATGTYDYITKTSERQLEDGSIITLTNSSGFITSDSVKVISTSWYTTQKRQRIAFNAPIVTEDYCIDVETTNKGKDPDGPWIQKIETKKVVRDGVDYWALYAMPSSDYQTDMEAVGYLYCEGDGNYLYTDTTTYDTVDDIPDQNLWTITMGSSTTAECTIVNKANNLYYIQYNSSTNSFSVYKNTQSKPYIYMRKDATSHTYDLGKISIMSKEGAFGYNDSISFGSHTTKTLDGTSQLLTLSGWVDDLTDDSNPRSVNIKESIIFEPIYGSLYNITFTTNSTYSNYSYYEKTYDTDITVDVDGYVDASGIGYNIVEGEIGTPTNWIDTIEHPGQVQWYVLPFFDNNTKEEWYPSDHWVSVFTTTNYFANFSTCYLKCCVNLNQKRGGVKVRMVAIDETGTPIAYSYVNTSEDGEIDKSIGNTPTTLEFSNWKAIVNGEDTEDIYYNENGENYIIKGKVRMTMKMCALSFFAEGFGINGYLINE